MNRSDSAGWGVVAAFAGLGVLFLAGIALLGYCLFGGSTPDPSEVPPQIARGPSAKSSPSKDTIRKDEKDPRGSADGAPRADEPARDRADRNPLDQPGDRGGEAPTGRPPILQLKN